MSNLFIGVKRIIAVDSSEFAYAEVDVDAHSMLVAEGNVGKSSLINAIRLFFLPECSMAKQAVNFGFSDSNGDMYGSETTFNHYFPSKYSFLVLEYEKRLFDGPHCCQIISASASGRLKFERMFTQLPYKQLRHLFWQQGDDPDGIGERVDDLSKTKVYEYIYKHDQTAVLAKEPSKVAELLFENELQSSRFTLFPLKNREVQTINSLRAIIKLLFVASSKNKRPFTDAIANIIEGSKKNIQDQLSFSISDFKEQHEGLKRQEQQLTHIINQQPFYQKLLKEKASFEENLAALEQVKPAVKWLSQGSENLQHELQNLADKNTLVKQKKHKSSDAFNQLNDDIGGEKRAIKDKSRELNDCKAIVDRFYQIQFEFPGQSHDIIKAGLLADTQDKETQLGVLNGNIDRATTLASLDNQINVLMQKQLTLNNAIQNTEYSLENQLSRQELDWLYSINPILTTANTGESLSIEHKQAISDFYALFDQQASHYRFFDVELGYKAFSKVNLEASLDKLNQEIEAIQNQKRKIESEQGNALHVNQSKKQIEQQLLINQNDLVVLEDFTYANKRQQALLDEVDICETILRGLKQKHLALESALDDAKTQERRANNDYQECQARITDNKTLLKRLSAFMGLHSKWLDLVDADIEFAGYINDQQVDMFDTIAHHLSETQFTLIAGLRKFVDEKVIDDKHGIKGDSPFWHEISQCFDDIAQVYGNLDSQRGLLGQQIEEHNQTIGTKKEIIIQNYRVIKAFEKEINQAFLGLTINNVASVEFEVGINKQFTSLVNEFEEINLYSNQMQSQDFYERLVAFAERFFDSDDTFTLTMDSIIESFEPRVQLANKSGKEDKKQSNSTNALIKIKLVQLLLKRLIYHNCETSFPVVHDEIANIDIGQFDWWLADLAKNGFNLMAAGTHSTSPELQAKIGRRHVMDAFTTGKPYHSERSRVYWQGAEEFTTQNAETPNAHQAELI